MDTIPAKRKRLAKSDSDIEREEEEEEEELSSELSASDRKVSFAAPTSNEPTPFKEPTPPSATPSLTPQPTLTDANMKKKTPRLVMKKMVLNDFKSYAGRQVIGPFHKVCLGHLVDAMETDDISP